MANEDQKKKDNTEQLFRAEYSAMVAVPLISEVNKNLKSQSIDKAVDNAFSETGATKKANDAIKNQAIRGVDIGRGGDGTLPFKKIKDPTKMSDWLLRATYGGDKEQLLKVLKGTGREYTAIVKNEIKNQFQANTNWKNVVKSIEATDLLDDDVLPKYMRDLESAGRRAIKGKSDFNEYRRSLSKAKRNISKLKEGTRLQKAYRNLVNQVEKGAAEQIEKAVTRAVNAKMRYNAERIARTEMEYAYGQAKVETFLQDDTVSAMDFILGSEHSIIDVCDTYATADLYGLGPGRYPKGESPTLAIHPNGQSSLEPVSIATVSEWKAKKARFNPDRMEEYLKKNPRKQVDLLGRKGAQKFRETGEWEKNLRGYKKPTPNVKRLPK